MIAKVESLEYPLIFGGVFVLFHYLARTWPV